MLTMILDRDAVDFKHFQKMVDGMMAASKDSPIMVYDGYRRLMKQTRSIRYQMSSGETVFIDSTHMLVAALEDYFEHQRVTPDTASDDAAKTPPSKMVFEIVYQGQHKTTLGSSQPTSTTVAGVSTGDYTVDIDGNQAPKVINDTAIGGDESYLDPQNKSYKPDACRRNTERYVFPGSIQDLVEEEIRKAKLNALSNTFNKAKYAAKHYNTVKVLGFVAVYTVHLAVKVGCKHWRVSRGS
jgi:hypothetical protein